MDYCTELPDSALNNPSILMRLDHPGYSQKTLINKFIKILAHHKVKN